MNPILILILVIVAAVVVSALVYVGMREDQNRDPLQERLSQFEDREMPQSLDDIEMSLSFKDRVILPLVKRFAKMTTKLTPQKQLEEARKKIDMAGLNMDPAVFFAMRIGVTITFAIGSFLVFFVLSSSTAPATSLLYTVGGTGLGYMLPQLWLGSKISRRQQNIIKALPDALDLLVICVEAGLGFDMALGKVYEKWDNELALAFGRVLREVQLGKQRRDALKDMVSRMDVPDVTAFIAAIIQADQLGVSLSRILRVQSDQMRVKRRQRAQEKAHQAPVKMLIPMVFLIFPSIWLVLLGPSAIILLNSAEVAATF